MADGRQEAWNILYIDDDREDCLIVRQMLAGAGGHKIHVDWAASYEEGCARIQAGGYDACLVDYDLGPRNGIEIIRQFHARCPAPFILYTSHDSLAVDLEAQQAGATLFLTKKDASPLLLERVIRYAIERKQAERSRDESQQRFQQVFEMSPDAVYVQVDEKFAFLNPAALALFGAGCMQQMAGQPVLDFIHPQDRAAVAERMRQTNQDRRPVPLRELGLLRLDGTRVDVEVVASPTQFEGRPGALVIARDIGERRRREANAALTAAVAGDFARLSERDEILQAVGEKMYRHFDLSRLAFTYVCEETDTITTVYDRRAPELPTVMGDYRLSDFIDADYRRQIKTGRVQVIDDVTSDARTAPLAANYQALGGLAQMLAPFVSGGKWRSLISLQKHEPYHWRQDEIYLLEELAPHIYYCLERARVDEAVRTSEARYRALYEAMDDGFLLAEVIYERLPNGHEQPVDLRYHQANPAAARILGTDFTGRRLSEIDPDFDRIWPTVNARVARSGVGERWERYLRLFEAWHSFYIFPVDSPGGPLVACIFRDITQSKHNQAVMAEDLRATRLLQELGARLVSEESLDVLYQVILSAAIELTQADAGSMQILDEASHELLLLAAQGMGPELLEHFARVDAGSRTSCGIALATGQRTWVDFDDPFAPDPRGSLHMHVAAGLLSAQSTPLVSRSGQPIGMFTTHWRRHRRLNERELRFLDLLARHAADLIERKLMDEALCRSQAVLQASAARNAFRIQLTDALRPLCNPVEIMATAARLLGEHLQASRVYYASISEEESIAHIHADYCRTGLASLVGQYREDDFSGHFGAALRSGHTLVVEDVSRAAVLSEREHAIFAAIQMQAYVITPLVHNGWLRALFLASQDQPRAWDAGEVALINETAERTWAAVERAQANEAALRYAQALESSNQALKEFAFIASHDLQEPLRKVQAFGELLEARYGARLDEVGRDYLRRMTSAAGRMQHMLQGLLEYSRVTSQGRPFMPVELNAVAAEVLSDLEVRLLETGGQVRMDDLPVIRADALQMRQLLQNLIGNALKYHRPGVPPRVTVSCRADGYNQIALCVQDNGVGFDMQDAGRLLDPFVRLHPRSQYEGSGMGLAICKKIVERHGGRLTFESAPGEGAVFTVVLPR